ncbi:MAG: diguanylate cyclase [Coriobacteriales bacterium]|jgi:diguanylate cyclase (GGDEF)-like protein|nr:diguanylate cyclase [Coriobacteriales bacterium]
MALVQLVALFISAGALLYALSCWRQRRMAWFCFAMIAVFFNVFGYFLEITAADASAAIVACKVSYIGVPHIGTTLYLFSRDYTGRRQLGVGLRNVVIGIGLLFTLAVVAYPQVPLFYQDLTFNTEGLVNHLEVTPGPLYYPCFVFSFALIIMAFLNLVVGFLREKRYEGSFVFFAGIAVPMLAQLYAIFFGLINGWNPVLLSLTLSSLLLALFLAFWRQAEWQSTGREQVVQNMPDAFILIDNKGLVLDYNLSAARYFPALSSSTIRLRLVDIWDFPPENYLNYGTYQIEMQQNSATRYLKVVTAALDADGKVTGTCVTINDDTVNHLMMEELSRLARYDELTGLNNRATFFRDATYSFDLTLRQGTKEGCALMLDIDFFKQVNDTYGHAIGDEVLRFIGALMLNRFRHTDILGRYGGEEFCVWMPATSLPGAYQVAEEIREAAEQHDFQVAQDRFTVTLSIGIASVEAVQPGNLDDLVRRADLALYQAKNSGRNRICVYQPDNEPKSEESL